MDSKASSEMREFFFEEMSEKEEVTPPPNRKPVVTSDSDAVVSDIDIDSDSMYESSASGTSGR